MAETQSSAHREYPHREYPQQGYPHQGYPRQQGYPQPQPGYPAQGFAPGAHLPGCRPSVPTPNPVPRNTALTRSLGSLTGIVWVALIGLGYLTFTVITPRETGEESTASGWGTWTHQGAGLELHENSSAVMLKVVLVPLVILVPTLLGALFILLNLGRRAWFIVNAVFAVLATAAIAYFVANPDNTTLVFDPDSNDYIMSNYDFAAGSGAYLILIGCVAVVVVSIIGAVVSQKRPGELPATPDGRF